MPDNLLTQTRSISGIGIGLRSCHYQTILDTKPTIDWFEILADNYLMTGGLALYHLDQVAAHYPLAMHSVGMSLGSTDALNWDYLRQLKQLAIRIQAPIISDHLCWVSIKQQYLHELMPLPYTEEAVVHVAKRIQQIQDFFQQQILIENVSSYLTYQCSQMSEWEFLTAVAETADCLILLDINNIYVSAHNHHFDPQIYLNFLPRQRIAQFHLAGFEDMQSYLLDSHGAHITDAVWQLYQAALTQYGAVPTLIERDNNIPVFDELKHEADIAKGYFDNATA